MNNIPIFVKVTKYTESISLLQKSRSKLDEAKTIIEKLEGLRENEQHEIEALKGELALIESKLTALDAMMKSP